MILILGGTTEGRAAVRVTDQAGTPFYYSTKGTAQEVICTHGTRLCGAMDVEAMVCFCRDHEIHLLIDAAHPFAEVLHVTVAAVGAQLDIPVIRYERVYPPRDPRFVWCDTYDQAVTYLLTHPIRNLLALTGVQTIARLRAYWTTYPCWFRVLNRDESLQLAMAQGFPRERVLFYTPGDDEGALLRQLCPDAIITKESGLSGFFSEKVDAAVQGGILVLVVKHPPLSDVFYTVTGEHGLRKRIEQVLPGFFPLRSGYTTGACATAATKAALLALLTGAEQHESTITLPNGEEITLPVHPWTDGQSYYVVKDAGDDPDVTNGCWVVATVSLNTTIGVTFKQGGGVGVVTLPGLGLEIGAPAINATPCRMMTAEITKVLTRYADQSTEKGVEVTLSIPGGEALAKRTFNPKLGIEGGLSIIGTSGIVRPFSSEAFVLSIRKEASVAKAIGAGQLVINSGAKSERYLRQRYPELPSQAFVQYGNFIGETIQAAASVGFHRLILGVMLGKAVKLAEGALDTHSKKGVMNKDFLRQLAVESGCSYASIEKIDTITLARELWTLFTPTEHAAFFPLLLRYCYRHCQPLFAEGVLELLLITEDGEVPYRYPESRTGGGLSPAFLQ